MKFEEGKEYSTKGVDGQWTYVAEDEAFIFMRQTEDQYIRYFEKDADYEWGLTPPSLKVRKKSFWQTMEDRSGRGAVHQYKALLGKLKLDLMDTADE